MKEMRVKDWARREKQPDDIPGWFFLLIAALSLILAVRIVDQAAQIDSEKVSYADSR